MMRQMIIIYSNVVSLGAFNTSIHVLSLSLNSYFTYNSSFIMKLQNEFPNINVLSLSNIFLMNKNNSYKIALSDVESDDILYNLVWKEGILPYSLNFSNSILTLSWNPTIDDIGNYTFELTYYDYLHRNQPKIYNFSIIVSKYLPPYFSEDLIDLSIPYWNTSSFILPEIKFDNNNDYVPQYNISVKMNEYQPLESWITLDGNQIIFKPNFDQLSISKISLDIELSELVSSISSNYILNVILADNPSSVHFNSIPDFSVVYPSSLTLNMSLFTLTQFNLTKVTSSSLPENSKIKLKFYPETKIIKVQTIENSAVAFTWNLIGFDNWGRNYSSNQFLINVSKRYPPSVSNSIPDQTMYVGETLKIIQSPYDLFYDQSGNIELGVEEWYSTRNAKITSSSVSRK